ncbi:MAG TPA: hypothetical protein PKC03_08665 [Dokdonella sp.]|nr:hypothetical protein [Dokdonella sp.]
MKTPGGLFPGLIAIVLAACQQQADEGANLPRPPAGESHPAGPRGPAPAASRPDQWIGRWNGPEGTYLSITRQGEGYLLEIADLDGPRTFAATRAGDHLVFERDGKRESLKATDGRQTGMKWLQDSADCLTIRIGEGYCRDWKP